MTREAERGTMSSRGESSRTAAPRRLLIEAEYEYDFRRVPCETRGISGQTWTGRLMATLKCWLVASLAWRIEQAAISALCR